MKKKEIGIALLAVSAVAGAGIALKKIRDHREEDKKQTSSTPEYSSQEEEEDEEDRESFYELLRMLRLTDKQAHVVCASLYERNKRLRHNRCRDPDGLLFVVK